MKINYFAYGSNMDEEQMRERKVSFSKRIGGRLSGYRLAFNKVAKDNPLKKGYANIVPDAGCLVEGALYEIDDTSLLKLDKFEGYPKEYLKITVKILVSKPEQEICAITYIANPARIGIGLKPDKEYLGHLLKGKDILTANYLDRLKGVETLD